MLGGGGGATGAGWAACLLDFLEGGVAACLGSGAGAGPSSPFSSVGFRGGGSLLPFLGAGSSLAAGAAFGPGSTLFAAALSLLSFLSLAFDFFSFFFTAGGEKHHHLSAGEENGVYHSSTARRHGLALLPTATGDTESSGTSGPQRSDEVGASIALRNGTMIFILI